MTFCLVVDIELMLPVSSLLCSYILGTKEKLRVLVPSDCHEELFVERNECSPYKEKAAVPFTKLRGFSALVLPGFNIYLWLLAETCAERQQ